jgi:hypothetical protein
MLREKIAVFSLKNKKSINTLSGQNTELLNVVGVVTCNYNWDFRGSVCLKLWISV